jgi:hypothetical protein
MYIFLIIIILLLGIKVLISSIQIHALILYMLEKKYTPPTKKELDEYSTKWVMFLIKK